MYLNFQPTIVLEIFRRRRNLHIDKTERLLYRWNFLYVLIDVQKYQVYRISTSITLTLNKTSLTQIHYELLRKKELIKDNTILTIDLG